MRLVLIYLEKGVNVLVFNSLRCFKHKINHKCN